MSRVSFSVSGGANFAMSSPMLTIGGFTQPGVARSLIEQPSNSERGLSSRFLWFFPECLYGSFKSLCEVDKEFIAKISKLNLYYVHNVGQTCCKYNSYGVSVLHV